MKKKEKAKKGVDKELEAYRRSLLRYRYEQRYINDRLDTLITPAQLEEYYKSSVQKTFKPGDRIYRGYHGKTLFAAIAGHDPVLSGIRVVGGHTDAPRLDLKPRPLYEKNGITYFDTHIYGGIKKFQWLVMPLALYGTVVKKDGTKIEVAIGDAPSDPVLMISDVLPHFGKDQQEKPVKDAVAAEDMDVIAGLGPVDDILKDKYGIEKDDLLSAELEIVPAGGPREVGLDRSLIAAYGHDDRVCAYAGLSALMDLAGKTPRKTCAVVLCDKEEIGSVGASGMASSFFENTVAELIDRQSGNARDIDVRRALERSTMLSADVCAASDPHFPDADSVGNAAKMGGGPCAIKYTGAASKSGASDARAEFVAEVRRIMDGAKIDWQMVRHGRDRLRHASLQHARAVGACVPPRLPSHEEGVRRVLQRL